MASNFRYGHLGQTYSRLSKCDSRQVISAEPAHHDRVESPPRNSEPNIQGRGDLQQWTCLPQSTTRIFPSLCLQFQSLEHGDRFSTTRLAGEVDVHVSTISPTQQSHSEAQDHSGGRSDTNSPLVAITTMVSTPTMCGPPSLLPISLRPTVTTGICLERQVIQSAHMQALMQHYQAAGFSKEVSKLAATPRRPSTNKMCDDR